MTTAYKISYPNILENKIDVEEISIDNLNQEQDNSITEIYCSNILELYPETNNLLDILNNKLRLNGSIYILGHNIDNIVENYLDSSIDIVTLNKFLTNKQYIFNISSIVNILDTNNFRYESIKTDSIYFYIEAKRKTDI